MARRTGRRTRRRTRGVPASGVAAVSDASVPGGRFRSLRSSEVVLIVGRALAILERVGVAGAPGWLRERLEEKGARTREDGRVVFARGRVEAALARAARAVALPGFREDRGIQIGGGRVHVGTGGAAVQVLDSDGDTYRASRLRDLHRMMRVLDACPNIHYGVRPLVARDMQDTFELDVNTAYACLRATAKPIGVSFDNAAHVAPVVALFDAALGREGGFRRQPFCMAIIVHVVPPLRFAEEGVSIMRAAIAAGMPLQICSAGQAGATSPAPDATLPAICETPLEAIRSVFHDVARSDCDAVLQVGTALPVVALLDELESEIDKPIVACNAAVYWQTLRAAGIADRIAGFGRLLAEH